MDFSTDKSLKIFNEDGNRIDMSDIIYKPIMDKDGVGFSVPILTVTTTDVQAQYEEDYRWYSNIEGTNWPPMDEDLMSKTIEKVTRDDNEYFTENYWYAISDAIVGVIMDE